MKRRLKWALATSVGVHAAFAVVWKSLPADEQPVAPLASPAVVEFEVVEVAVQREPLPVTVPPPIVKRAPAKRPSLGVAPAVTATAVAESLRATGDDSPRPAILLPRKSAVVLPAPDEQQSKGHRIRNLPDDLPDPAAVLAYEAAVVRERVDGWAQQTLARSRVENGVVSYYFHQLRHRLEQVTQEPPPFIEPFGLKTLPQHGEQAIVAWSAAAKRYGKTGTAYEETFGYSELHGVAKSEAERGGRQAREFAQKVEAAARLRDFGEGRMGEELVAIVEVKQSSNGSLADLSLISPSSSIRFDNWVMAQAPKAVDGRVTPPDAGVGIHAAGMRSIWAFKGRVTYKRNIKETQLLEDGWYLALMAAPALLTGTFDELSGKVEYIDLRHPRYECRVELLEVY